MFSYVNTHLPLSILVLRTCISGSVWSMSIKNKSLCLIVIICITYSYVCIIYWYYERLNDVEKLIKRTGHVNKTAERWMNEWGDKVREYFTKWTWTVPWEQVGKIMKKVLKREEGGGGEGMSGRDDKSLQRQSLCSHVYFWTITASSEHADLRWSPQLTRGSDTYLSQCHRWKPASITTAPTEVTMYISSGLHW